MDSNGDGVGDLQGIKSKLKYVKDLGMDGVWFSPIYKSPMADFGYDISDYRDIHEEFGTLQDFYEVLDECNRLGLKLVLDFVPNHSSGKFLYFYSFGELNVEKLKQMNTTGLKNRKGENLVTKIIIFGGQESLTTFQT